MTSKELVEKVLVELDSEEELIDILNHMTIVAIDEIYDVFMQSDIVTNYDKKAISELYSCVDKDKTSKIMTISHIVGLYKKLKNNKK